MESIVNAYKSMYTSIDDQQKSLNEAMHHLAKHMADYSIHADGRLNKLGADGTPEGGYKRDTHRAQSDNMRVHHKTVAGLHRACADKLAADPHHGPGHPLHIVHHVAADAHEQASKDHHKHIGHYDEDQHVSADFDVDQTPKSNAKNKAQFGHAMKASVKAMGLSNETNLNNVEESTTDIVSEGDTNNLVSWFSRMVGTKAESEGKPMGGNITKLHGIGKGVNQGGGGIGSTVRNFFGLARNKDHEVSDQTMMGGVVNHLQRNRRMIEMLGDSYTNTNINAPNQGGMTSIINNLGTSMGGFNPSNTFADITNTMTNNSGDISSSNNIGSVISDLTNNVLNESSQLTSEMNDTSALESQMSNIVKGSLPSPNLDMESGGSMAISNVKISPFFTEYANTAQFT